MEQAATDRPHPTLFLTECRFCRCRVARLSIECPNCAKRDFVVNVDDEIDNTLLFHCIWFWEWNAKLSPHDRNDPDQMIAAGEWDAYMANVSAWLSCAQFVADEPARSVKGRIAQLEVVLVAMRHGPNHCMSTEQQDALLLRTLQGKYPPASADHDSDVIGFGE